MNADDHSSGGARYFVFPGNIEDEILEVGAKQVPYARTLAFGEVVLSCELDLLRLLDCPAGRVLPFTASGTAAMEAVVANLIGPNDRVLVLNGGTFGQRWVELTRCYPHGALDVYSWEDDPDYGEIESRIQAGGYHAVLMQHHETSTGSLIDIARIGKACRNSGALSIVDAIGSFLADPLSMSQMDVDVAVLSSQKGLNLPPGLAFVVLNQRGLSARFYVRGLYWDFTKNLESLERGQTLFSPAALMFLQLRKRLDMIDSSDVVIAMVAKKAQRFRACLAKDGRGIIPEMASNCLTSFRVNVDARMLCQKLAEAGWYVMPSKESDQVRVSHLGVASELDHLELYERIAVMEKSLKND